MMTGEYYFNNIDSYLAFGVVFKKGAYSELLSIPGAWPNETRKIALPIVIAADNEADFWVKYNAFRAFLKSSEEVGFNFFAKKLNRRFKLSYESISNFTMLTRITGGNKVYCDFVLNVIDDYPNVFTHTVNGKIYSSFSISDAIAISQL